MQGHSLGLHCRHWHRLVGVVNRDDTVLRSDQLHAGIPVAHVVEDRDVIDELLHQCANLRDHVLAVVDDVIGPQFGDPGRRLGARCRGDDRQAGGLGQLDTD
ncbi:hypothetical protein SAMN05444004_13015 [Jannaschia faecimaris]|uniref:Uncharacterized protein n=2 Tax=Jannaschia faecimaris TaxID=1244108 RepID=A0A1H3UDC1_9RHOB|nr:hypothetical protein SAMN05444004_13015 [Jannaschia faecimaris]